MQLVNIWGAARTARKEADAAEVRVLRAALEWALANPPLLPTMPPSNACPARRVRAPRRCRSPTTPSYSAGTLSRCTGCDS